MKNYDEFIHQYKKYGTIDAVSTVKRPNRPLNERQLETYYNEYCRKFEQKKLKQKTPVKNKKPTMKEPSMDSILSKKIRLRDSNKCRLLSVITFTELIAWKKNNGGLGSTIDSAHVLPKSAYPHLRFNEDNLVCLNRYSHSMLDTQHCPLTGALITIEEHENWWKRIVGEQEYLALKKL
ncbi:MAG: hypothetical protein ACRCZB_05470 [Bacteroidales bacterium]